MTDQKRPYRKKRRAELEEETRRRITESAIELHGSVGPSRTSMSAIAERAGVRRSTLYRHFPDDAAVFEACSTHWMAENPRPDVERWAEIADPADRLRVALSELYAYYDRTEPMLANLHRDEETVRVVKDRFSAFHEFLAACAEILARGWPTRGRARRRTRAALGHAVAFASWHSLVREQGLDEGDAVELMCRMVAASDAG
jgi:AcrR family transcriptional regulator